MFTEVAPTLRSMRSLFRTLPLDGPFDLDLNDFLFEEAPLIPLPQTGQPIVQAQQTGAINELTPTQEALLSPEEKVIARRN